MIRLFAGYDERESKGFHVFVQSVIQRATVPVAIIPLASMGLPEGSNTFTTSRFLIPHLCGYEGMAIFADASDMAVTADISELAALYDDRYAVQVVKHDYKTRHKVKYRGTEMECPNSNYDRKNWASLMLINCAHPEWIGPGMIEKTKPLDLLQFRFLSDESIGSIDAKWNTLVDEGQEPGAVLHWTAGIPGFEQYANAPCADFWRRVQQRVA